MIRPRPPVGGHHRAAVDAHFRHRVSAAPPPRVAEPDRRQHVDGCLVGSGVRHGDADADVRRGGLGVVDVDHPVPVLVEDAGVDEFVLRLGAVALGVLGAQVLVREFVLRVVVAKAHPGVRWGRVGVPVVLLDILAVIALSAVEAEQALLEDRVLTVPQRQRKAGVLQQIAQARQAVLVPAEDPGVGVFEGEVLPGIAVRGVVLAHRPPCPLGQVGPPLVPGTRLFGPAGHPARLLHPLVLTHPADCSPRRAVKCCQRAGPRRCLSAACTRKEAGVGQPSRSDVGLRV